MSDSTKSYKASKLKTFMLFVGLALVFWVLTKFSKETVGSVNAILEFTNLPSEVSLSEKTPEYLDFNMTANGFQFLSYKLKKPTVSIDISNYYEIGDTLVLIADQELKRIIETQLTNVGEVNDLPIDELALKFDAIVLKKVPVVLDASVQYKEGYLPVGLPTIMPDSVTISGPSEEILAIEEVKTAELLKTELAATLVTNLALVGPTNFKGSLSVQEVTVQIVVEEFTQKQIRVPITVNGVPENVKIRLIPEEVVITFDVSLSRFNGVSAQDFKVSCSYDENTERNFLMLVLEEQPADVRNIVLSRNKVEYLIFR